MKCLPPRTSMPSKNDIRILSTRDIVEESGLRERNSLSPRPAAPSYPKQVDFGNGDGIIPVPRLNFKFPNKELFYAELRPLRIEGNVMMRGTLASRFRVASPMFHCPLFPAVSNSWSRQETAQKIIKKLVPSWLNGLQDFQVDVVMSPSMGSMVCS